jgi:hypothetical protein
MGLLGLFKGWTLPLPLFFVPLLANVSPKAMFTVFHYYLQWHYPLCLSSNFPSTPTYVCLCVFTYRRMCILCDGLSECEWLNLTVSILHICRIMLTLGYVIVMGMNVGSLYIMSFSFHVHRNTVFCRASQYNTAVLQYKFCTKICTAVLVSSSLPVGMCVCVCVCVCGRRWCCV